MMNLKENLTGTAKQIAWATEIRAKAIQTVEDMMIKYNKDMVKWEALKEVVIENETEASVWIETRCHEFKGYLTWFVTRYQAEADRRIEKMRGEN
jgi:hypothetical protein